MEGSPKPISRRRFLAYSAAALALPACASSSSSLGLLAADDQEPQFYIPSPRYYLNLDQDFSKVQFLKTLKDPSGKMPADHRTHLTVIGAHSRKTRMVSLPGLVHNVLPDHERPIMIPTDGQRWLYSLDARTLEIAAFTEMDDSQFAPGGHALLIPGTDLFAVTTNSRVVGKFDRVSLRDRKTLKEVHAFSSHGIEAHDMRISADGKHLYVGHYGSLLGSGPYKQFSVKDLRGLMQQPKAYRVSEYTNIYPASITVVELSSGKLVDRLSSVNSGAHCHFVLGSEGRVYLPHRPTLLTSRKDTMTNPMFHEGEHGPEHMDDFRMKLQAGFGTSIAYDGSAREVIIPSRWTETINVISESRPDDFREIDLKPALPKMEKTHGLAFHPDGKHYVTTGNNWLATLERGTHKLVPEQSFSVQLFLHAHTTVG